jgi:hypothetical protein
MNLEKINNISDNIETLDKKERKRILLERITQISLVYADKKFNETKENENSYKFSDAVKNFTPLENIILKPVFQLEEFDFKKYKEKVDIFLKDFYIEIDFIYNSAGLDLDQIQNLINLKINSIKKYLDVENLKEWESTTKEGDLNVLKFNDITNIQADAEENYQDLEKLGFSKFDHFIEVHVEDFYNSKQSNLGPELIKSDLKLIAEYIIDKKPETAAIIGRSWLLNTPLASRLGFKPIEDNKTKQNDFSTWLQFIDKNGEINQKRFNQFLKTEELPYKSVKAYILTEDFLKRYLPESRKGRLILKKRSGDREGFWYKLQNDAQSLKLEWDNLLKNNDDFDSFIKNNELLNEILNFLGQQDKISYVGFLKKMYNDNILWAEFYKYKDENIKKIDKKFRQFMKDDLYKEKEVFIT